VQVFNRWIRYACGLIRFGLFCRSWNDSFWPGAVVRQELERTTPKVRIAAGRNTRYSYGMLFSTFAHQRYLGDMRTLLTIALIWFPALVVMADDCPLQGKWKSDAARTLADIATRDTFDADAMNAVGQDLFGHMIHEWTCTEFRAYSDNSETGEAVTYQIHDLEAESFIVTVHGETEYELKFALEGVCYKVLVSGRQFYEYFCPI